MLISHHTLRTPIIVSCGFFFVFGGVALVSRFRVSSVVNTIFKSGVGAEYQSWFEHFLSGFASSSLLFVFSILFWYIISRGREGNTGNTSIRVILRIRAWLLSQSEHRLYILLLGVCVSLYIATSANWEFSQFQERGTFQFGHFTSDVVGSLVWFFLLKRLCSNPSLQGTRCL